MTVVSLVLLAVVALAPALSLHPDLPAWLAPVLSTVALAGAAAAASATTAVHGFAYAVTLVLTMLAAITGGGPAVLAAFRIARRQPDAGPEPAASGPGGGAPIPGPLRGGRVIGILERAAVAGAVLAGWPEGIAIVLAVKGLARYPELREPQASEQFIIGTGTSVLWALAVCGVGWSLLT
ncbi:hypothetical protein [Rhodococcus zopfii]|uniref:hypothetical protein n=1 Tax=Rhodococcus zopfii TaxID=43772 RepID=UPI0011111A23|nr:hypothetical protein [Rhodococcus zopfii]